MGYLYDISSKKISFTHKKMFFTPTSVHCINIVHYTPLKQLYNKPKRVEEEVRLNCRTPKVYCVGV